MPIATNRLDAYSRLFMPIVVSLMLIVVGCQQNGSSQTSNAEKSEQKTVASASDSVDGSTLLDQMTAVYQKAGSYEDAGELHMMFEGPGGEKQESPPIPFSVAFERPSKVRVHSLGASIVADGDKLRATTESLENQVLVLSSPETLTSETLFSDKLLAEAARGQVGLALPQLALLVDKNPLEHFDIEGTPKRLEDADLQGEMCHRVTVKSPQGTSVFWISAASHLLLKFEFPTTAIKEKFSLANCSIWAEMKGAQAGKAIAADAFKMEIPGTAKLMKRFLPPPPAPPMALLAQSPDDFSFVDFKGGTVTRDSLQGKVVVLDLWATWCGWCFKGFPNLEQVYQQFKDNDKVVIVAVNTDEPNVTDEQVRKSFETAKLTIPIVRDQMQITQKIFVAPGESLGLPTMIILGSDGKIEDYHMGYDAQLAETLPKRLTRLLAGESLAKEEIEKYEQARKEYEQQLSDALADDDASGASNVAQRSVTDRESE